MERTGAWGRDRTREFLETATVPLRLACHTPAGHPWILSLWFVERDGRLWCATKADADVVEFLDHDADVAFEVSTNDPPYRGVRGRGTATVEPDADKDLLRALLERYLGGTDNGLGDRLLAPGREEVRIGIEPERLHTWDFSGRMRDVADGPAGDPAHTTE